MDEQNKIIESREVTYRFSPSEAAQLGRDLAAANGNIEDLEERKKASASQYSAEINAEKEQLKILNRKVGNGYEYRNVDCEIQYHIPDKGYKTVTRTDLEGIETDELRGMDSTWQERMTEVDWEKWNDSVRDQQCTVEMHAPDEGQKTYTQTSTGHKFIESMSGVDHDNWEEECEEELNTPEEGQKTLTHKETGKAIVKRMNQDDIEKLQTTMFPADEMEGADSPQYEEAEEVSESERMAKEAYED